jgi:repressor LexA
MQKPLTPKQRLLLQFIETYTKHNGYPPSLREMAAHMGIRSASTIHQHLHSLEVKGLIKRDGNERERNIIARHTPRLIKVPLVGEIAAGLPIVPIEESEPIFVSTDLAKTSVGHYALRVIGDSMIEDGIQDGDIVIIKSQNYIDSVGQVIVAITEDGATLKRFAGITEDGLVRLRPRNPRMSDMLVNPETFEVRGKFVGLTRSTS